MDYTPNFQHKSVRKRCEIAVTWIETHLRKNQDHWLSTREIDRHLTNKALGHYLRKKLLTCTNEYYDHSRGICKTYRKNPEGIRYVQAAIGMGPPVFKPDAELISQLESGNFDYSNKSNRQFHALQFRPKIQKRPLLQKFGYRHEYDIKAAAHTLLLQHAKNLNLDIPTPAFDAYITDRTRIRLELAEAVGTDVDTIKLIMTAMLQGAYCTSFYKGSIIQYLNFNIDALTRLKNNSFIKQFQIELRAIWRVLKPTINTGTRERASDGKRISLPISPREKSSVYRCLEESVRVVIQRHLKRNKNRYFFEHDGWSCVAVVDVAILLKEVKQQTGFVIELEWIINEYTTTA